MQGSVSVCSIRGKTLANRYCRLAMKRRIEQQQTHQHNPGICHKTDMREKPGACAVFAQQKGHVLEHTKLQRNGAICATGTKSGLCAKRFEHAACFRGKHMENAAERTQIRACRIHEALEQIASQDPVCTDQKISATPNARKMLQLTSQKGNLAKCTGLRCFAGKSPSAD